MKMRELVKKGVKDWEPGEINQLIRVAYFLGREGATRTICDKHNAIVAEMRERANQCRYHHMAHTIIGERQGTKYDDIIYSPDYACDFTNEFGNDEFKGDIEALGKEV